MSEPLAIYSEGRFPHRRTSVLHPDRIELAGSTFLSSKYQATLPLSLLSGQVNRMSFRPSMFGVGILIFLAGLITAALGYFGRIEPRPFNIFEIIWMLVPVVGIIILWVARKIEVAHFTGTDGVIHYEVARTGRDRARFDQFVAQVREAVCNQRDQSSNAGVPPLAASVDHSQVAQKLADPIASYSEAIFSWKRISVLYPDRIEVTGSLLLSSNFQSTIPLSRLSDRVDRVFFRTQLFSVGWLILAVLLIKLALNYLSPFSSPHSSFHNDKSSATRPTRAFDCNLDATAGFAAAHG